MASVVLMPKLGLDEDENFLGKMCVSEGDTVKAGDELFSIETDKSTMSVFAEESGTILKLLYGEAELVPVKAPVCIIGTPGESFEQLLPQSAAAPETVETVETAEAAPHFEKEKTAPVEVQREEEKTVFSPRARQLAQANGITLAQVAATGAENRALAADVRLAMAQGVCCAPVSQTAAATKRQEPAESHMAGNAAGRTVTKLSGMRCAIGRNMRQSLSTMAQTTQHIRYNATRVLAYREWLKTSPGEEKHITINDIVTLATIRALAQFPYMNGHLVDNDTLELFDDINMGMAIHTERGLMAATIKKAQNMTLLELSQSIKELAQKCREHTITPQEQSDATFTISNMGADGLTYFTPIVNPPQLGILGVGNIDYMIDKAENGMLFYPAGYLSFTYDHRATDGVPAARFLKAIKKNLEEFQG